MELFTIHASKDGEWVETHGISPTLIVAKANSLCDLADPCGLRDHILHGGELAASVAGLASSVLRFAFLCLRKSYAAPRRFLDGLSIGLCRCCQEADQRVANGLLHRVLRRAVRTTTPRRMNSWM